MSYLALARRYRPQRLVTGGRVSEDGSVEIQPWMGRGFLVRVRSADGVRERLVDTPGIDDAAIAEVILQLGGVP
jgi:hypothetical protein